MKAILLLLLVVSAQAVMFRKNLAGPPDEFSTNLIPNPDAAAIEEKSATLEMYFEIDQTNPDQLIWSQTLPVDSETTFSFNVFSLMADYFQYQLLDPSGIPVELESHIGDGTMVWSETEFPGTNFLFTNFATGVYELTVTVPLVARKLTVSNQPEGIFVLFNESPVRIHTHLNTYHLHLGAQVGLVTKLTGDGKTAMKDSVVSATMIVRDPSGKEEEMAMHDDGLHSDGEANDGVFGAYMTAEESGTFSAEALISGKNGKGTSVIRSSQHLIPIVEEEVQIDKKGFVVEDNDVINIFVKTKKDHKDETFRAYGEVWGKNAEGNDVSVAWVGGIVQVEKINKKKVMSLSLDKKWLALAGASGPLVLRNFYLQDIATWVPLTDYLNVTLRNSEKFRFVRDETVKITAEMREGKRPAAFIEHMNKTAAKSKGPNDPNLILIHGYCADSNPWPTTQFTKGAYFLWPSVSVTTDAFANAVFQFASSKNMTRYGSIAHSQGGMVQVHLHNYYWSGYDNAVGAKLLQSVGTPYMGCSAAGSAANIGKAFGVGCGTNTDLSTDGAALWNVGISAWARSKVSFYTTSYKLGTTFGDYCNLPIQMILDYPNDGTAEIIRTTLVNGTNMGSKQQWCHTTGMKYTAQYLDTVRNAAMNTAAAR